MFSNSDNMDFQRFLDTFDTNDEEMYFNTTRTMNFVSIYFVLEHFTLKVFHNYKQILGEMTLTVLF